MNQELFKKIHDVISVKPEQFSMSDWEGGNFCGTTRCIAGWAVHLETGKPIYQRGSTHPSVYQLADRLGVLNEDGGVDFEDLGRELLNLDADTAGTLFYVGDTRAAQFVQLAANGYEAEALSLLQTLS